MASVEDVAARIVEFLEMRVPEGLIGKLKMLPKAGGNGGVFSAHGIEAARARKWCAASGFSLFD